MQVATDIGPPIQTSRSLFMQKKSLVNTLKSTKKEVNVMAAPAKNEGATSRKAPARKAVVSKLRYL